MKQPPQDTIPLPADASFLMVPHCILLVEPGQTVSPVITQENFLGYEGIHFTDAESLAAKVHPDDAEIFARLLSAHKSSDELVNLRMQNRACSWEPIQSRRFTWLRDEHNQTVQAMLLLVPVNAMRLIMRGFMDNEARYRALVRQAWVGILIADDENRIVEWNDAFTEITGYPASEVIGKSVWDVGRMLSWPDSNRSTAKEQRFWEREKSGQTVWFGPIKPFRIKRKDGEARTIEAVLFPIHNSDGLLTGMVIKDISERELIENALCQQVQRSKAVANIAARINSGLELDKLMETALEEVAQSLAVPFSFVHLHDTENDVMKASQVFSVIPDEIPAGQVEEIPMDLLRSFKGQIEPILVLPDIRTIPGIASQGNPPQVNFRSAVAVSLEHEGNIVGSLTVLTIDEIRTFQPEELTQLQTIAEQLAQAIIQSRLLQRNQEQARNLRLMNEITRKALESNSLDKMLPALSAQIVWMLSADGCYISLWDEDHQIPIPAAAHGANAEAFMKVVAKPGQPTLSMKVLEGNEPCWLTDYAQSVYSSTPFAQVIENRPLLALPLKVGEIKLGSLLVGFRPQIHFSPPDMPTWKEIASQISLAIYKVKLLESERIQRRDAEILQKATAQIAASLDLSQVVQTIVESLKALVPHDLSTITVLNASGDVLVSIGEYLDVPQAQNHTRIETPFSKSLVSLFTGKPLPWILEDMQISPGVDFRLAHIFPQLHAWMAFPLTSYNQIQGYLIMCHQQPGYFTPAHARKISPFIHHAAMALQNARLFEQVQHGRERLQQLSRRLVEVQEEERRSLAHELHDEVGQSLTALNYALEMGKKVDRETLLQTLDESQALIGQVMNQVRGLSLNLRPGVLDDLGLMAALEWLFKRFQTQTSIQVKAHLTGIERRFSTKVETSAFRVVQEALTNSARYAQVNEVSVHAAYRDGLLHLMVQDQGRGFDLKLMEDPEQCIGLSGMFERTSLVGGLLDIQSSPGTGTTISAIFPVERPVERRQHERKSASGR